MTDVRPGSGAFRAAAALLVALALLLPGLQGCAKKRGGDGTYTVRGQTYRPLKTGRGFVEEGTASWYGPKFSGGRTSSGERYNPRAFTAAHRTLPFGSMVEVTNLGNGRKAVVRVNDRGPFVKGRVIDVSGAAAQRLGMVGAGVARVRLRVVGGP